MKKKNFGEKLEAKSSKSDNIVCLCAPERLSFEHFLPWIYKIMLAYLEQEETESENYSPEGIRYSKSYYIKKFR